MVLYVSKTPTPALPCWRLQGPPHLFAGSQEEWLTLAASKRSAEPSNVKWMGGEGSNGPGHPKYSLHHLCMNWHVVCYPTSFSFFVHIVIVGKAHLQYCVCPWYAGKGGVPVTRSPTKQWSPTCGKHVLECELAVPWARQMYTEAKAQMPRFLAS